MDILLGGTEGKQVSLRARMANRHGLIAGATGTGKTVTLQSLAEGFSRIGVPVFMADVKGDLTGLAKSGAMNEKVEARKKTIGAATHQYRAYPVVLWDIYGKNGHPVRTTISDLGPLMLAHLLELNETQTGVLYTCFRIADDQGLLLLDLKDTRAMLSWLGENAKELQADYGSLPSQSINAIQRALLVLEEQGGAHFFGEPALELADIMRTDFSGNGVISIIDATKLIQNPRLYTTFLLWLLAELFEQLPEAGDLDKPKLVFFFDEAHLLFNNAPKVLLEKIEQVVRLIRSKGVGVYFISQNPQDIPDTVLGQLGNRVQHALRAFTPKDQKAVRVSAQTFRANPAFDTEKAITELRVGEALVSTLDDHGSPTPVERVLIVPPESRIGPMHDNERIEHLQRSPMGGKYDKSIDRESAYEILKQKAERQATMEPEETEATNDRHSTRNGGSRAPKSLGESAFENFAKSAARAVGSQLGRQIMRGVLGSLLGTGRKRR